MRNCLLICFVLVLSTAVARAQTLAERVPADAVVYIGWKGADTPGNGYDGSHLQAIIDASGFAQLRDQVIPQLMQKITAQSNDHGEGALAAKTMLEIIWRHPSTAFFGGVAQDANGKDMPKFGLICQAGKDTDALMTIFNAAAHGPGAPPSMLAFTAGDCAVALMGYDNQNALPGPDDAGKSLKASAGFIAMTADLPKDSIACAYVDAAHAFSLVDDAVAQGPDEESKTIWPKVRDASGLTGIKHAIMSAGFDGRDWQEQFFIDAPAPRTGLLTALEPAPIDPALLARIPSTATTAALAQFSVGEFFKQIRVIAGAVSPDVGDMFDKGMGMVQMMIGRSLQHDILEPLGSQWATYGDASIPESVPTATQPSMQPLNLVLVNKLIDPAKALQGWTMLSYAASNASARFIQARHLPVSMAMTKNGDDTVCTIVTPYYQPSWTIKDGFMYFGFSPEGVIAAANHASGASITEKPDFAELAKKLNPTSPSTGFGYTDLKASISQSYPAQQVALEKLRAMAQQQSITLPDQIMPPLDKVLAEVSPALGVSWADAAGYHGKSKMPFPAAAPQSGLVVVGGAALGVSIMLPSLNRARETANRVKCASDERQMGQACLLFANDHKGQMPANIADMLTEGITPEIFLCPSSNTSLPANYKTMAPADLATWVTDHGDYVYCAAGQTSAMPADQIVVYEKPEDHVQGMNILYGDGHVEFDLMPVAVKLIKDQNKTVPSVKLPDVAPVQGP